MCDFLSRPASHASRSAREYSTRPEFRPFFMPNVSSLTNNGPAVLPPGAPSLRARRKNETETPVYVAASCSDKSTGLVDCSTVTALPGGVFDRHAARPLSAMHQQQRGNRQSRYPGLFLLVGGVKRGYCEFRAIGAGGSESPEPSGSTSSSESPPLCVEGREALR
jgi:hypothetical protein